MSTHAKTRQRSVLHSVSRALHVDRLGGRCQAQKGREERETAGKRGNVMKEWRKWTLYHQKGQRKEERGKVFGGNIERQRKCPNRGDVFEFLGADEAVSSSDEGNIDSRDKCEDFEMGK